MSQFPYNIGFPSGGFGNTGGCGGCGNYGGGCGNCGGGCGGCNNAWTFFQDECYLPLGSMIDDRNMARNCSCNFRCCICGGWCAANGRCTRCENICIDNCERNRCCGCNQGCGCGCGCNQGCGPAVCRNRGTICLRKVSATQPTLGLAGATFELSGNTTNVIQSGTTNANGDLCFTHLPLDTYTLREIVAPPGYQINTTQPTIQVTPAMPNPTLEIHNQPIAAATGTVSVLAVGAGGVSISGVTVALQTSSGQTIATQITSANGMAVFSGVALGTYMLVPTQFPIGITPTNSPVPVSITSGALNPSAQITFGVI